MTPATAAAPKRVRRRRRRKHEGPPTFQFVTATDPEQFKDRATMKGVRSQAMIQYRYKLDKSKESSTRSTFQQTFPPEPSASTTSQITSRDPVPPDTTVSQLPLRFSFADFQPPDRNAEEDGSRDIYRSLLQDPYFMTLTGYRKALIAVQLDYARIQPVSDHETNDERELAFVLGIVEKLQPSSFQDTAITYDGSDPFRALPQFSSKGVSSVELIRQSTRYFVASTTLDVWVPIVMTHPYALLSTCCVTSTYVDMMNGLKTDSEKSTLIKNESIVWINRALSNQATQTTDMTIILILHLLAGELRNCDENVFRIHESGIERIIVQKGGMDKLGWNGVVAELTVSVVYDTYIFTERQPATMFQDYIPKRANPLTTSTAIPESPLYCPRSEFFTIAASPLCTEQIYNILSDMRDLTEIFLSHQNTPATTGTLSDLIDPLFDPLFFPTSSLPAPNPATVAAYETKLTAFQSRLAQHPSAHAPNHAHTHNWLYESIRLAAVIYTAALVNRIPLSAASYFPDPALTPTDTASFGTQPTDLTVSLYETMKRTDMTSCWGGLSGVFFCVSLIGAAASRTSTMTSTFLPARGNEQQVGGFGMGMASSFEHSSQPRGESDASFVSTSPPRDKGRREWARRCMVMYTTRVRTVLVFGHPVATIAAQKRLLAVMEVLGRGWCQ